MVGGKMSRRITAQSASVSRQISFRIDRKRLKLNPAMTVFLEVKMDVKDNEMFDPAFFLVFEMDGAIGKMSYEFEDCAPMVALLRGCSVDLESFLDEHARPPLPEELIFSRLSDGKIVAEPQYHDNRFLVTFTVKSRHPRGGIHEFETKLYIPQEQFEAFLKDKTP